MHYMLFYEILIIFLGEIDKFKFDKLVKTKMFGNTVVYYPSNAADAKDNQKRGDTDTKLIGMKRERKTKKISNSCMKKGNVVE